MDDTWNTEFDFHPYPEHPEWGGLGMQVKTRLFQWAQPLAKDILFMQYAVSNAGADAGVGRPRQPLLDRADAAGRPRGDLRHR